MKNLIFGVLTLAAFSGVFAASNPSPKAQQNEFEREIDAVVRNKYFYKKGRIELGLTGGLMPYDTLVKHYMLGGKAAWHLTDYIGWEIIDAQFAFPATESFTKDLVVARGLSNLQTSRLKQMFTTNILFSPFYGKIRFFGSQVLYFDIYLVAGGGLANTETLRYANAAGSASETLIRSGMEPAVDWGVGVKIFMSNYLGLVVDLRDYMVMGEVYGKKSFKSNFSVLAGLCFNLPSYP